MPLPERYAGQVPKMERIWESEGYFRTQTKIWQAQCEAKNELEGIPSAKQLASIRTALQLTPQDIEDLNNAKGHETNTLLRKIQSRLSPEEGNFIHKGNTSSDVLDTSLALQTIESLSIVKNDFNDLKDSLLNLANKFLETPQVARSHTQHAIPQTFGRQVVGWYAEIKRGIDRINQAKKAISFGKCSGEVGTNVFIAPELEERALAKLGLKPDEAPTQVISRDRHATVIALMAVNGATLARIATNIRLLAMTDVGEVREPFDAETQQGSSAMPHKRNTELTERICGLNRRIRSGAAEELDAVIIWLERDISHSSTERFVFPDVFGCLTYATHLTKDVIDGLVVYPDRMLENLNKTYGAIYSSRLLNELLETKKMSRTEAYELVKKLAQRAMDKKTSLEKLAAKNAEITRILSQKKLTELFDPNFYLRNIDVAYKRLGLTHPEGKKTKSK